MKAKEEEDQSKALAAIGLRVSPEFLGIITDANGSARTAWEEFSRMFQSVTNARKMMLREKLASAEDGARGDCSQVCCQSKGPQERSDASRFGCRGCRSRSCLWLSRSYREIRMALELQERANLSG